MLMKRFITLFLSLMLVSSGLFAQMTVVSGLKGGTYSQLANDIKRICAANILIETSNGNMENLARLKEDENVQITFLQYDVLLTEEKVNAKAKDNYQILLPLFLDEEVHLITLKETGIKKLKHLKGKKVAIGSPEQGTFVTAKTIKNHTNIDWEDVELQSNDAFKALQLGEIDAMFYVGGMPVAAIQALPEGLREKIQFVKIRHPKLKNIYETKTFKPGTYSWYDKKIKTIAIPTLMVVNVSKLTDEQKKEIEVLYWAIKDNVKKLQESGHKKWTQVYYKNQDIKWPYYYVPERKD